MKRRNFSLSARHDEMLVELSKRLDISMVATLQRALEALKKEQSQWEKEVK